MAFWKAGVEYEDKGITGPAWAEFKASPQCEFGQMPVLILEDGTCLSQSIPVLNYVGAKYGLRPADPMAAYKGDKAVARFLDDYMNKKMAVFY